MKQIHFFALREDLLPIIELVESKGELKYAVTGNYLKDELKDGIRVYSTAAELPNLGTAEGDSSTLCESFLVCEAEADIKPRCFQGNDGERVCVGEKRGRDSFLARTVRFGRLRSCRGLLATRRKG